MLTVSFCMADLHLWYLSPSNILYILLTLFVSLLHLRVRILSFCFAIFSVLKMVLGTLQVSGNGC